MWKMKEGKRTVRQRTKKIFHYVSACMYVGIHYECSSTVLCKKKLRINAFMAIIVRAFSRFHLNPVRKGIVQVPFFIQNFENIIISDQLETLMLSVCEKVIYLLQEKQEIKRIGFLDASAFYAPRYHIIVDLRG